MASLCNLGSDPTGDAIVRYLAEEPAFIGIGFASAGRLRERFGASLFRVLDEGDVESVSQVLGEDRAERLITAWREEKAQADVVVWLAENGFDQRLARKIRNLWGTEAPAKLREKPYVMMALAEWPTVDAAARRLGVLADAPERLVAAVEAVLYDRYQEGHTWMDAGALCAAVARLLGGRPARAEHAVEVAVADGAVFPAGDGYKPAGAHMMESYVLRRLGDMLHGPQMDDLIAREVGNDELSAWLDGTRDRFRHELDPEQREAVRIGVQERFGIVTGGAGVGKTTVLRAVCEACEAFGRVVHLMALAGRAAVRMREATGRPAMTIAAFLRRAEAREIVLGPESLIVIDEASMVDLPTFYSVLRHLPDGARLLAVGDPGQLPPIGFGLILHVLINDPSIPKTELIRVYRQTDQTGIPAVGRAVRDGLLPALPSKAPNHGSGVILIPAAEKATTEEIVDVVADLGGFTHDLRIVSAVKAGPFGIEALNERFHAIMAVGRPKLRGFAEGEPVMFLKNDYRRDLRNGSLGVVSAIRDGTIVVDFDGAEHEFSGVAIDDLTLAYAITVHKSQGSQFRRVVMPVARSRLLDRSLVYTAITRATEMAVIVGAPRLLEQAVSREQAADRREVRMPRIGRPG